MRFRLRGTQETGGLAEHALVQAMHPLLAQGARESIGRGGGLHESIDWD